MKTEELYDAFKVYWDEMDLCRRVGAFWALLHVTVCLPDICAALESSSGETTGKRYQSWCDKNLKGTLINGLERWDMRCHVLHQGRAGLKKSDRYTGFSFARPSSPSGISIHGQIDGGGTLILDVRRLSEEMERDVREWIRVIAASTGSDSANVERNLPLLVRVRTLEYPKESGLASSTIYTETITRTS